MIAIFTTSVQSPKEAEYLHGILIDRFPTLKINMDINDSPLAYPCTHSILRVEGQDINAANIISTVMLAGFHCDILEDKVCAK